MEINYGFIDSNNVLIGTSVCVENDIETIERIKEEYSAVAYHPIGNVAACVGSSLWIGDEFTIGSPFPSWVWNNSVKVWEPPIPYPSTDEKDIYDWDEDSVSWVKLN